MAEVETVRELRINGRRLRVAVRAGEGRPLLMCNGIGARLELLQPFLDRLDPAVPVIRFDVPGIGGSELPRVPYNFATLACLLGEVLDELRYGEIDVLGISWGGGLAQKFAFQNPRRCRRLVLVATATGMLMVPAHPRVLSKMITPRRYRDSAYAAEIASTIYGGRLRTEPELAREILHRHADRGPGLGYALQLLAGAGWTSLPFLPLIRQPTLILAGDDDPIVPVINAKAMHRLLPRSTLHIYPDGHLGLVTRADDLGPRVAEFLRPRPVARA
ncbi:poly(3-hydroxyalkanoate) depolymerase [Nocardia asteroides]|uniref:poly(3-hydroxyalkanoate) depolymerase n=1 Tax=Nocardia asteroides TaxID=1824 RepID=UPI001E594881|nr:poly(3-hydroxyalkanoate) depolymerase [Nocardia asteroides]UGT55212.1 poly(3-hydroxyalkanoate) depolymerase [Nocardia asteroides]